MKKTVQKIGVLDLENLPTVSKDGISFSDLAQFKLVRCRTMPPWDDLATGYKPSQVADYWRKMIATSPDYDESVEQFATIFLTGQRRIFGHALISKGSYTEVESVPPCAFRTALMAGAPAIVIAHNHPQDSPQPSDNDCFVFVRMKAAAKLIGLDLLDAMVIGEPCDDYPLGFARISQDDRVNVMAEKFLEDAQRAGVIPKDGPMGEAIAALKKASEAKKALLSSKSKNSGPLYPPDVLDQVMRYENGELDQEQVIALFQGLINTGLAWQLQGHYGRTAANFIRAGLCTDKAHPTRLAGPVQMTDADHCRNHKHHGLGLEWGKCACSDPQCPVCAGKCERQGNLLLFRRDCADSTGTVFCEQCAEDVDHALWRETDKPYCRPLGPVLNWREDEQGGCVHCQNQDGWTYSQDISRKTLDGLARIAGQTKDGGKFMVLPGIDGKPPIDKKDMPEGWHAAKLEDLLSDSEIRACMAILKASNYDEWGSRTTKKELVEYLSEEPRGKRLRSLGMEPGFMALVLEHMWSTGILKPKPDFLNDPKPVFAMRAGPAKPTGKAGADRWDEDAPSDPELANMPDIKQAVSAALRHTGICLMCGHEQPVKPGCLDICEACGKKAAAYADDPVSCYAQICSPMAKARLRKLGYSCNRLGVDEDISQEVQGLITAMHLELIGNMKRQSEANRHERLEHDRQAVGLRPGDLQPDDVQRYYSGDGTLVKASANQYGGMADWLYGEEWEKARKRTCPKCGRPKPLTKKAKAAIHKHLLQVGIRTCLIVGLLALAFGFHQSWKEGLAFGLMDLAVGPITDGLWEVV